MELDPPIEARTTDQLKELVANSPEFRPEVVEMAEAELSKRQVNVKAIHVKGKRHRYRLNKILSIKENAAYTPLQVTFIVILGPILALIFRDPYLFQPGDDFTKKNRQGLLYLLLGIGLWAACIYLYDKFDR